MIDAGTGTVRWEVQNYPRFCWVAMSPDGRFVASVGESGDYWQLWDVASGVKCMAAARHDGTGGCSCPFTRSGRRSLDAECPVRAHTDSLFALAFSPCGHRLATAQVWAAGPG